jgi:four helix bundle protein
MSSSSVLAAKAMVLAVEGVKIARLTRQRGAEYSIFDQLIRATTSPGALIAEAADSESKADMRHKFGIALKECRECSYWLDLIQHLSMLNAEESAAIRSILNEVTAMLVASQRTLKQSQ